MKRLLVGVVLVVAVLVVVLMPGSVAADINLTQTKQMALSCTDGHSVIFSVDSTTLSSLTADVRRTKRERNRGKLLAEHDGE